MRLGKKADCTMWYPVELNCIPLFTVMVLEAQVSVVRHNLYEPLGIDLSKSKYVHLWSAGDKQMFMGKWVPYVKLELGIPRFLKCMFIMVKLHIDPLPGEWPGKEPLFQPHQGICLF